MGAHDQQAELADEWEEVRRDKYDETYSRRTALFGLAALAAAGSFAVYRMITKKEGIQPNSPLEADHLERLQRLEKRSDMPPGIEFKIEYPTFIDPSTDSNVQFTVRRLEENNAEYVGYVQLDNSIFMYPDSNRNDRLNRSESAITFKSDEALLEFLKKT